MQFVWQQAGDTADNDVTTERLCVWNVDTTAACAVTNAAGDCIANGYQSYCVYPWNTIYPLPGDLATDDFSEVVGYVLCNQGTSYPAGPNGCILVILGYLATVGNNTATGSEGW